MKLYSLLKSYNNDLNKIIYKILNITIELRNTNQREKKNAFETFF